MIPILAALVLTRTIPPHGLGCDDTYTITAVLKVLRPCDPAVMTDPYQDVRVLADDGACLTLSITYFPLDDKVRQERIRRYATPSGDLTRYLRPTVTCNWDPAMRDVLVHDLRHDGIDPAKLRPADLVSRVAAWAFQTSSFASNTDAMPSDWFVSFAGGRPLVAPSVRQAFRESKPNPEWTDQQVFDHQLLGRQMFASRSHGACTSSSIYLATLLRALGVPTRILYFIPPCDGNDPGQIKMLQSAITRTATRQTILNGIPRNAGFANHMFDEVWIDGRWQRLNYGDLGQEIVDENYLGLMTHIDTCADISETHLSETWGVRATRWPDVPNRLSSKNPYRLIAADDHRGRHAVHDDSAPDQLTEATVTGVLWPGARAYRDLIPDGSHLPRTDLFLTIKEWIPTRNYMQLREFIAAADPHFVLRSPGRPAVPMHYNGLNCNNSQTRGFGMCFDAPNASQFAPGVPYTLVPRNQNASHRWRIAEHLQIIPPAHIP